MSISQRYKVILKDHGGVKVAEFDNWRRLQINQRLNSLGSFSMLLTGNDPRINLFTVDSQVEVWRRDVLAGLPWYLEFEGFHRDEERETLDNNLKLFTSKGVGYNDLLARRIVAYFAGDPETTKSGPAETVMKEFVDENLGPLAAGTRLAIGTIPGFSIAADTGAGPTWEGQRTWKNILKIIQEIASFSNFDFNVIGTTPDGGPPSWIFQTYPGQLGKDRTNAGLDPSTGLNAAGYTPIIFSLGFGNMRQPKYRLERRQEVNALFSLGEGEGTARDIVEVTDPIAIAASPFNRREASRNGSNQSTISQLTDFGIEWLLKLEAKEAFEMKVNQTKSLFYGLGPLDNIYHLGDRITVRYDEIERNKRIVGSSISVDGRQRDAIDLEFSNQ